MSPIEIPLEDVVTEILESPAPVLFPDTCFLVDLIRLPQRSGSPAEAEKTLKAAQLLASNSQNQPPRLWIVILPPIYIEWREHSKKELDKLREFWSILDKQIQIAYACADATSVTLPTTAQQFSNENIDDALFRLSESLISHSIHLADDTDSILRGRTRSVRKEAPGKKGANDTDCVIIEHCFALCNRLRDSGFSEKCIFATSNVSDFLKKGTRGELQEPLNDEFDKVNLMLTTNWQWTGAELRI